MNPIKLKIHNFQSFSDAEMDFNFSSALIIGERDSNSEVSNGAGKTSIFEAIVWCLFGKSKQKLAANVVRYGADECWVEFEFEVQKVNYRIIRKKNKKFSKAEVLLFKDGVQVDADTKGDIDIKIEEIVHSNYEVFLNTSYFVQRSISEILCGTPASRQKLLGAFLNSEKWEKAEKKAKDEHSIWEKKTVEFEAQMLSLSSCSSDVIEGYKEKIKQIDDEYFAAAEENQRLSELRYNEITAQSNNQSIQNELGQLESQLNVIRQELGVLDNKGVSLTLKWNDFKDEREKCAVEIKNQESFLKSLESDEKKQSSAEMEKRLQNGRMKQASLQSLVASFYPNEICKCCNLSWSNHQEEYNSWQQNNNELAALNEKIIKFTLEVQKQKAQEAEVESVRRKIITAKAKASDAQRSMDECMRVRGELDENIHLKEEAIDATKKRIKDCRSKLVPLNTDASDHNLVCIQKKVVELSQSKGMLTMLLQSAQASLERKKDISRKLVEAQKQQSIYKALMAIFGRKGIPAVILDNIVADLMAKTNNWLSQFSYDPMYIKILTQKTDSKGNTKDTFDIEIHNKHGVCEFEALSGGESFKVAFAMRLALSEMHAIKSGVSNHLLLLDEVSTALDKHGIEVFTQVIRVLEKKHMKILVISHDDNLKEEFSSIVTVKRFGATSTIAQ